MRDLIESQDDLQNRNSRYIALNKFARNLARQIQDSQLEK